MALTESLSRRPEPPAAERSTAVSAEGVSKAFRLPHQQYSTLKERALHPMRARRFDVLQAVDDVTFHIADGEFFGIVGRNGSGKSTLLKCLAGIYRLDAGELHVAGRLSPFIELGVGFNMELTARDNVIINAIMLGLTRREARERFDTVIDFAGLHDFLDLKLKNYSSGMLVRLAFSVAIQVDADVLLIDEVLAVGDAAFQQKCFDEFERLKRSGRTIVFVSHDMNAVERFCDRAMIIEHGKMVALGEPVAIARRYRELNFGHAIHSAPRGEAGTEAPGCPAAEIKGAWFENLGGERIKAVEHGDPCVACVDVLFHESLDDPTFGFTIRNHVGHTVFATTTNFSGFQSGAFAAGDRIVVRMRFDVWLTQSRYLLTPSVARHGTGEETLDLHDDIAELLVHGWHFTGGVTNLPHDFSLARG